MEGGGGRSYSKSTFSYGNVLTYLMDRGVGGRGGGGGSYSKSTLKYGNVNISDGQIDGGWGWEVVLQINSQIWQC